VVHRVLERAGRVERWTEGCLRTPARVPLPPQAVHVVTDAAGSITRADAAELGITLLPSYLLLGGRSLPETLVEPDELYRAMRSGVRVTTAQASVFERHQSYDRILGRCERALYLCVGSVYTGNHAVVTAWKREHDPEDRLTVLDTGLASGRLGIVARATAQLARTGVDSHRLLEFARAASERSEEYLFLDRLQYLAAGGRLSKTRGLIGDLLHVRPVITPTAAGAQKVGTARTCEDQLAFAAARLDRALGASGKGSILLEHSDNADWVRGKVLPAFRLRYPAAEIMLGSLSLTSGAHMGPGTWGVAVLPDGTGQGNGEHHARV
jgi:DegV family protein with EDD domain